jgi:oligo-1,6-glucosidase
MLLPDDSQVYAFRRRLDDVELLVLGNFSGETVTPDLADADVWTQSEVLITNYPAPDEPQPQLTLRPWETRVYRRPAA